MKSGLMVFLFINFLAYTLVFAQDNQPSTGGPALPLSAQTPLSCAEQLIQADVQMQEANNRLREARLSQRGAYDEYLQSFNTMTDVLFQMTSQKEEETKAMAANRDQLHEALTKFSADKSAENSKQLQDSYYNLTVQLYTALADSQKRLESLKSEISQVESTRGQYDLTRKDIDQIEQNKLFAEQKLVNLQLKCRASAQGTFQSAQESHVTNSTGSQSL